jgi:hypothetical protein
MKQVAKHFSDRATETLDWPDASVLTHLFTRFGSLRRVWLAVGDVITVGRGEQLRVVAIDDFPHAELVEQGSPACSPSSRRREPCAAFGNFRG